MSETLFDNFDPQDCRIYGCVMSEADCLCQKMKKDLDNTIEFDDAGHDDSSFVELDEAGLNEFLDVDAETGEYK